MFFPFQFPAWLLASPSTLRSPYCRPLAGVIHTLAYQSLPTSIPCGEAIARRRTEDRRVGLASGGTVERWRRFSSRGSCTRWRRIMISSRKPGRSMYITSTPPPGQSWGGRGGTWHARPPGRGAGGRRSNCLRSLGLHDLLRGRSRLLSGVHVDLDMRDQVATRDARDDDQRLN